MDRAGLDHREVQIFMGGINFNEVYVYKKYRWEISMNRSKLFCCSFLFCFFVVGVQAKGRPIANKSSYGTHMAPLITAVMNTDGPILEMGCGDFSTPLLHAICAEKNRFLLSAETDEAWMNFFLDLERDWHQFCYVNSEEDCDKVGADVHWSVVLIDHAPAERRIVDIKRLRKNTDIFVVHDTEQRGYNYKKILPSFKYKFTYKRYSKTTTLVSDTVDVAAFFND